MRMSRRSRQCRLVYTDERFVHAKRSYAGVPLLVDADDHFVDPVCDYLRARVVYGGLNVSSARTYAEHILHFWSYLQSRELPYDEVNDEALLEWFNTQKGATDATRGARCNAVFDLYVWLEREGYVHRMVRIPGFNDDEPFRPQLSSRPARIGSQRHNGSKLGIVSALRPRQQSTAPLPTPDTDDIGRLHAAVDRAANLDVAERNHLLLDWYLQAGVRRMEWRSLTLAQVPPWDVIDAAAASMHAIEIALMTTKGGRPRHAGALPELLERTREYIEGPRRQLVERFKRKLGNAYREPDEVFLSNKTGAPMEPKAISNLLKPLFEQAQVEGHGHRLRATYLTRLFEAELMMEQARAATHSGSKHPVDFELVLRRVAERAGHRHIDSLRPYLTLARKRLARQPGSEKLLTVQQLLDAKLAELAHTEALLQQKKSGLKRVPRSPERPD
jgi:site-specific recombinase XerD